MKKSLIKTLALSLIAASVFSVTTGKSAEADDVFGKLGKRDSYNKSMAMVRYAKTLVDKSYYQMPDPVKIDSHWCAAFTKFLCGITDQYCDYNSVTYFHDLYEAQGLYHTKDSGYIPGIGDLIIYEEDDNTGNGYEHIGIVVNTKYRNGEYYPETIEGNYFDIPMNDEDLQKITAEQYRDFSNSDEYKYDMRRVGYVPSNRVRRHMVAGYIEMDRKSIDYIYGDVNGDGNINMLDAFMILKARLQMDCDGGVLKQSLAPGLSTAEFYYRMDANGDGKVTQTDATAILRYLVR